MRQGTGVGSQAGGKAGKAAALPGEGEPIERAIVIMDLLRSPEGCPWDREQTFDSIKRHTLEETYEVFDAIERRSWPELKDELGDLLLQVLFYAQMAKEAGYFDIREVAANLNAKLIRRHPHVFGEVEAADANAVLRNWEEIKQAEKKAGAESSAASLLDGVPRGMPAMMEADKLGSRAAKVEFDWPDVRGVLGKLREETAELEAEIGVLGSGAGATGKGAIEEELGDLLFTAVNLGRHVGVDAEEALRKANAKFRRRFTEMEKAAGGADGLRRSSAEELDRMWVGAKLSSDGERSL